MIATMAVNQPPPRTNSEFAFFKKSYTATNNAKGKGPEPDRRTTLVLAPASLLQQVRSFAPLVMIVELILH